MNNWEFNHHIISTLLYYAPLAVFAQSECEEEVYVLEVKAIIFGWKYLGHICYIITLVSNVFAFTIIHISAAVRLIG